ncbi:MAG: HipA domain-containing protein [Ferribacterium limneticum]
MSRELDVYIEAERIGRLFENTGIWSFQYDTTWQASGYPIAPRLPLQAAEMVDTGTERPVQWFFDNLLPEEMARTRLVASLEKGEWDAWRLLERFGSESAGALTLLKPGDALAEPGLNRLADEQLQARILAMPHVPLGSDAPKKMSLAGAQEKLPVVVNEAGEIFDPVGSQISTHILKPDALSEHYPASAVNEWFCARVAQELKLNVPPVELRYLPSCVYLIERFDRAWVNGTLVRRHALDAAQLLSLSAGSKYTMSGASALNDVVNICRAKAPTRIALFRWALFNVLIGNHDAHLKNISLYAGHEGYSLAPHYDLLSTASWARPELVNQGPTWPDIELSFPIGDVTSFRNIRREHLFQFAEALKIPEITANRQISRLVDGIIAAADKVMAEFEHRDDVPANMRAGQLRMLRSIRHLPVAGMQAQLSG